MSETMWTRSNGQKVPIASMNDHHLKAAINKMKREHYVSARAVQDQFSPLGEGVPSELLDQLNDELVRRQGPDYLGFERSEVQF